MSVSKRRKASDQHNFNFETYLQQVPGTHELYGFLADAAVNDLGNSASIAYNLRMVNKECQKSVDEQIPVFMAIVNSKIGRVWHEYRNVKHLESTSHVSVTNQELHAERQRTLNLAKESLEEATRFLIRKFGNTTALRIRKMFSEFIANGSTLRNNDWGFVPNMERDIPRFSETVHSFNMLCVETACELNIGKPCRCRNDRGAFSFVPNGRGLVIRSSHKCVRQKCVRIEPHSDQPFRRTVYPKPGPIEKLSETISTFVHLLNQVGMDAKTYQIMVKNRMGDDIYKNVLELPYRQLKSLCRMSKGLAILVFDTASTRNDKMSSDSSFFVPTIQSLLKISDKQARDAVLTQKEAERFVELAEKHERKLIYEYTRGRVVSEINRLIVSMDENNEWAFKPFKSLEEVDVVLPGAHRMIDYMITWKMCTVKKEQIHTETIFNNAFVGHYAPVLTKLIANCLVFLVPCDKFLNRFQSSAIAYSYMTGFCVADTLKFNEEHVKPYLLEIPCAGSTTDAQPSSSSSSQNEIHFDGPYSKKMLELAFAMHVFDHMDPSSIRISPECKHKSEREWIQELMNFKDIGKSAYNDHNNFMLHDIAIEIYFKTDTGHEIFIPFMCNVPLKWLYKKHQEYELNMLPLTDEMKVPPIPQLFMIGNVAASSNSRFQSRQDKLVEILEFAQWMEKYCQAACLLAENRCFGIEMMTYDSRDFFVDRCAEAFQRSQHASR